MLVLNFFCIFLYHAIWQRIFQFLQFLVLDDQKKNFPSIITLSSFIFTVERKYILCSFLTALSWNEITKSLFNPWKLGWIKYSKYGSWTSLYLFVWDLFQLIVLLKPDFNFSISFSLSCVDKVAATT